MVEVIAGALVTVGGASLCTSSVVLVRAAAASPIARARELLGNTDKALASTPADMTDLVGSLTGN